MSIVIDPEQIEQAADTFARKVAPAIDAAIYRLSDDLAGTYEMAGGDKAGSAWSSSYDNAAQTVMGVGADLTNGTYKLAGLLEMTWGNHARADADSAPGGVLASYYPRPVNYADLAVAAYDVPFARGGVIGEPRGWSWIRDAVGFVWPGGDQARLRAAGRAWGTAATAMSNASLLVPPAVTALQDQHSPEIASAVTVSQAMQTHICDLSNAYTNLQNACDSYADFVAKAHHDAEHELQSLVKWTVGIETAGAIFSVISVGTSEVGAQAAEGTRIAVTAGRVAGIIRDLIAAAKGVCETITGAVTRALEISRKLKALLGARLTRATTEAVTNLPDEASTAEGLAESRLLEDASKLNQALARALDPVRIGHVFDNETHDHELEQLISAAGSREAAMEEIIRSIGDVPDGVYGKGKEIIRTIRGIPVKIRGRMFHGVFQISTAFAAK